MPGPTRYLADDHLGGRTLLVAAAYVALLRGRPDGRDEVLLLLRAGTGYMDGYWAMLAGHVDPGESFHEAAVREAAEEEAGVIVRLEDLTAATVLHRFERGGPPVEQRVDAFFTARRFTGVPALREAEKAAAIGWFPLDELPDPVVPHERFVLDGLGQGRALPAVVSLPF